MAHTLAVLAVINSLLLVGVVYRPTTLGPGARKVIAFGVLGLFPLLWGGAAFSHNYHRIQKVEFCATCHAMSGHVDSLTVNDMEPLSAVHYQNNYVPQETACYTCHTDYTWFGPLKGKVNGIKHVYVNYFAGVPEKIEIYDPYQNRDCLKCHGPSKRFLETPIHNRNPKMIKRLKEGTMSCLTEGCHDLAHLLPEDWS